MHVAVRPENVTLDRDPVGTAKVTDVSYVGGDIRVEVQTASLTIVSRVPSQRVAPPSIGDRVSVSFAVESLCVVAD